MFELSSEKLDGRLVVTVSGSIDSGNADEFAAQLQQARLEHPGGGLEVNAEELSYISSAGLRVLLKASKTEKSKVRLVGVNDTVYEILEQTGFNQIIEVRRAPKEISVEGFTEMAKGATGKTLRVDDEVIIKIYSGDGSLPLMEHEREMARQAFVAGIPTAMPLEMVHTDQGFGVFFGLGQAETLSHAIATAPSDDEVERLGRVWGKLLKEIHGAEANVEAVPSAKDLYISSMRMYSDKYLSPGEQEAIEGSLSAIPDVTTFLHGDPNPDNIMIHDGEPLIIDMAGTSHGHPIFDLSAIYVDCVTSNMSNPDATKSIYGISKERMDLAFHAMMAEYFGTEDGSKLKVKESMMAGFMAARLSYIAAYGNVPDEVRRQIFKNVASVLDAFDAVVRTLDRFVD